MTPTPADPTPVHYPACNDQCIHYLVGESVSGDVVPEPDVPRRLPLRIAAHPAPSGQDRGVWLIDGVEYVPVLTVAGWGPAAPDPAPLDVERVARIFHDRLDQSVFGHAGPVCQPCRQNAKDFAREYATEVQP